MKLKGKTPEEQEMIQAATEYLRQEGRDEGLQKGLQEGLQKGLQKGREEIAANMLRDGMDLKKVVQLTQLNRNAVHRLQREIDRT